MGLVCKVVGHKWNGCVCARCGERNPDWRVEHEWGAPKPRNRKVHRITCVRCGDWRERPHGFEMAEGCTVRCAECGYVLPWHDFADGICVRCGVDESGYYRDLVLSGELRLVDREEAPCREALLSENFRYQRYVDHLHRASDLAQVVALYRPCGSTPGDVLLDEGAVRSCVYKLGQLAHGEGDEAAEANRVLYEMALQGPEHCRALASTLVCDPKLASDPTIAEAARRERERDEANQRAAERYLTRDGV